jgi:hypothetical protein
MDFIENTNSDMSSFLELGPEGWGGVIQRIKVPVPTVDDYSAERGVEHIHLLKIDTQGFDFEAQTKCWRGGRIDLLDGSMRAFLDSTRSTLTWPSTATI